MAHSLLYKGCIQRSVKVLLFKGGEQKLFITIYNSINDKECKAKTTFTTWLANLNYII